MAVPQRVVFNRKPKSTDKTRGFMGFWRALTRGRIREDRGAYAILFAILCVLIFVIVALVVDLGEAKATVRGNQSVADFAALAAGPDLEAGVVNPQAA